MLTDTFVPFGVWTDLYAATGIAKTKRLVIAVKGTNPVMVWEGATPPGTVGGDNRHGFPIFAGQDPYVNTDLSGVWVLIAGDNFVAGGRSSMQGRLSVQEFVAP